MIDVAQTGPQRMGIHLDAIDHATGERTVKEGFVWFEPDGEQITDEARIADLEAQHAKEQHDGSE